MRAAQPQLRLRARAPPSRLVRAPRAAGGALASVCRRRAALASCDWTPTEPCRGACRRRAALAKAAVLAAAAALGTTPGRADAQPGLQEGGARTSSGKALLPDPDFDPNASALVQSLRTRTEQNKAYNDQKRLDNFYKRNYRMLPDPCDPRVEDCVVAKSLPKQLDPLYELEYSR
eukprot:PRCOL_00002745-RA